MTAIAGQRLLLSTCVVDLTRRVVERGGEQIELPPREAELLAWFATHPVRPASRQELLREVWGYRGGRRTRVVDMTVRRLREKIELRPDEPVHLLTVRGMGYRFEPPERPAPGGRGLPPEPDRFFGRGAELEALLTMLEEGARRITVVGPPGVGKTRLARRAGRAWLERRPTPWPPGGVVWVDCARCVDLDDLLDAALAAAGEQDGAEPAAAPDALAAGRALAAGGPALVVLDNLEQACEAAARLVSAWAALPALAVLGTSREPLEVAGERCLALGPLPGDEAAALLVDRTAARRQGAVDPLGDRAELAAICGLLDGLPLALELAAAQLVGLSPGALRERLARRPLALEAARRDRAGRHASLRQAIATSWELLAPWEQAALAQLSVFAGAFTLDAAEAALELEDPAAPPAWEVFKALERRSLLASERQGPAWRFRLLQAVRAFAAERLTPARRLAAEQRHGAWFTRLRGGAALDEIGELLAATERALQRGDAALATAGCRALASLGLPDDHPRRGDRWRLQIFWDRIRGALDGAAQTAERAVEDARAAGAPGPLAQALLERGWILSLRGALEESEGLLEEAEARALEAGERRLLSRVRCRLGMVQLERGARERARETLAAARRDVRAEGDPPRALAYCLNSQGYLALVCGELEAAAGLYRESYALSASLGDTLSMAWCRNNLGETQRFSGELDGAEASYREAAALFERARSGDGFVAAYNLELTRMQRGEFALARPALEQILALAERQGRRARAAVMRCALMPCAASAGDGEAFDQHLAAAGALLAETGFRDADVEWLVGLAAEMAAQAGWPERSRAAGQLL
jgi:predicted ATPase/DNA-binding winged helix-turn-helix (wHTH) protein